jgi:trehalose 6-phosphate phosphatase
MTAQKDMPLAPDPRLALFLDVDGTLLDIAESPVDVVVPFGLTKSLHRTWQALSGALALISGRSIVDLDRLFQPLRLPAAGQHGREIRLEAEGIVETMQGEPISDALRREIDSLPCEYSGVMIEDKGQTIAVHYRANPKVDERLERRLTEITAGSQLALVRGRMVIELRDPSHTKGSAVAAFMAEPPFIGRLPVFLGDDRTDEDGFAAVERLGGRAMPVGRLGGSVRQAAFASPGDVRDWLSGLTSHTPGGR